MGILIRGVNGDAQTLVKSNNPALSQEMHNRTRKLRCSRVCVCLSLCVCIVCWEEQWILIELEKDSPPCCNNFVHQTIYSAIVTVWN